MSQYDELQKAAAYAAQDTIKFADESEEMRAHQQFHEEVDPETVLALIADLDEARNGMKHSCAIRLKKEIERLEVEVKRMTSIAYASHGAFRMETLAERDQLRAEVAGLRTGYEAYEQVSAELKAEVEALRKSAPSKEVVWCSCGDGHAANSYGAGFMDANGGVCANCDAAMGSGRPDSRGSEQGRIPTETPIPDRSACRSENP